MNQNREGYEYHITLLSVRMRVKFPCKMKIEHQGSLLTADIPSANNENRYIFNQDLTLKNQHMQTQCFQFVLHLVTDKGARYIGGVVKLYHSEMIRSQGEKLSLSLSKCIDTEAFCEVRINRIMTLKDSGGTPFDRKSSVLRNVPSFRPKEESQLSPYKNVLHVPNYQSKSQFNFPVYQSNFKQDEWDNRTKIRYPPASNHSRVRTPSKYGPEPPRYPQEPEGYVNRQSTIESGVYKQQYKKLKEKYKKEAQISKQQLNKRLALENSENNLKLQIMRLRMKQEEQDKTLNEKTAKLKEFQNSYMAIKQKEGQNSYLLEQIKQKQATIQAQSYTISSLTADLTDMREMTRNRGTEESYKLRQLKAQVENLKIKLQNKQKELEHQIKARKEIIAEKQHEVTLKQEQIDRNKKIINDLEKGIQVKNYDLEKMLQNDRSNSKSKVQELKAKVDKLQRQALTYNEQKRESTKKLQELNAVIVKVQYQKKLVSQQYESLQQQSKDYRNIKEKYNQIIRQNKNIVEQRSDLGRQIEKVTQSKQQTIASLSRQLKQQTEHFKEIIRNLEAKDSRKTNEITELDSQLQQAKNQLDKHKKTIDSLNRQLQQCKDREKNAKRAVKSKQNQSLGIETQYATLKQKLKTIDQIYKLQADKITEETQRYRIQLEESNRKLIEVQTSFNQLTQQHNKVRARIHYAQERSERDATTLKEKQTEYQNYIKDSQEQITDLEKSLATIRISQKELNNKLQRIEVDTLRKDERAQKTKRDLRIYEEKCNNLETTIKSKNNEIDSLITERQMLGQEIAEKQAELTLLRSENMVATSEKGKLTKIHELVQQNLKNSREQVSRYIQLVQQKEKKQSDLLNAIKIEKQNFIKLQFSHNSLKKQYDRNRQLIYQNLQKYIIALSAVKEEDLIKNMEKSPGKIKQITFPEISNMIASNGKQLKQQITKLNEQNKQNLREIQKLRQSYSTFTKESQQKQSNILAQMTQLQEELTEIYEQKKSEKNNFTIIINQLNEKLNERQYIQEQLNTQVQQLNFTINSIKLDSQALNEQNTKRMATLRKVNLEWQEKAQNLIVVITELEERNKQLSDQTEILNASLENSQEQIAKRDKVISNLEASKLQQQKFVEILRKKNKELSENLSDCELYLSSQKQINQKLKQSLESEQKSSAGLKAFISQLMKQKQAAIKNDLEKNQSISHLQTTFLQLTKNNQLAQEENQRLFFALEAQKETNSKNTNYIKELEENFRLQKRERSKIEQKHKEKQKQLISKEDIIKKTQQKYEKTTQKLTSELNELRQELQRKQMSYGASQNDSNHKITALAEQVRSKKEQIKILSQRANQFQESNFVLNQKYAQLESANQCLKAENQEFKLNVSLLDANINELSDQIKQKQQKLFQYSGRNYTLELKLDAKENEFKSRMDEITINLNNKFDGMCEEYEQRIEIIEKQRDYFKFLSEQRDKQVIKTMNNLKSAEQADNLARKTFQEKTLRQQEEKIALITSKNNQIQKYSQELRLLYDNIKSKQSQLRRAFNELEISKKTIVSFDIKFKENDEKIRSMTKIYQAEIDQLKKKDSLSKSFKETVSNHQWNCERETKKSIQNFIRSFLEISEDKNNLKVIELARALESAILQALTFNLVQK